MLMYRGTCNGYKFRYTLTVHTSFPIDISKLVPCSYALIYTSNIFDMLSLIHHNIYYWENYQRV